MVKPSGQDAASSADVANKDFAEMDVEEAFGFYQELRGCPVAHSDRFGGFYWLSRYEDVRAASLDPTFSSARKGVMLPPDPDAPRLYALEQEAPGHAPWRRLYMEALKPERMKAMEPRLVELANGLIDNFARAGECDLMSDFAELMPFLGVCATIGVSGLSASRVRELSGRFGEDPKTRAEVIQKLGDLVVEELLERRAHPQDDYLTRVATAELDGRLMTEAELGRFMSGFLTVGHETTTSAMGVLLFHAFSQPALRDRMKTDEKVIAGAIEESLRLYPPFHAFHRTTDEPITVGDVTIPADATVRLCYGAANRDPAVFERPDAFDPDRGANPHMGFGFGRHVCVGAPLARLEMRTAVKELLRRLPDIQVVDEAIEWKFLGGTMAIPAKLRAKFTPAPRG